VTPTQLTPEPGAALSPGPWTCTDDVVHADPNAMAIQAYATFNRHEA
jgi:hypothetical protein